MPALHEVDVSLGHGESVIIFSPYKPGDAGGVVALAFAAGISCVSVVSLLILIASTSLRSINAPGQLVFVRTHVAAYFVSLLFSDFVQSLGSLLSIRWVGEGGVTFGAPCTAQGAIKNGGNVGTAVWSVVIALHTFSVLFLGRRPWEPALYATLIGGWSLIGFIVVLGPGAIETDARGPYFGISGLWCWITQDYQVERLALEYMWLFSAAFISFVLYALVFLKLRGNIVVVGWRIRVRRASRRAATSAWDKSSGSGTLEAQLMLISRKMMLYPIAYTVLILPIAICRYISWTGHIVPDAATLFADFVFLLTGFVNVVLFVSTRRILPADFRVFFRRRRAVDSEATLIEPPHKSHVEDEKHAVSPTTPRTAPHTARLEAPATARLAGDRPFSPGIGVQIIAVPDTAYAHMVQLSPRAASKVNANMPPPLPPKDAPPARAWEEVPDSPRSPTPTLASLPPPPRGPRRVITPRASLVLDAAVLALPSASPRGATTPLDDAV